MAPTALALEPWVIVDPVAVSDVMAVELPIAPAMATVPPVPPFKIRG